MQLCFRFEVNAYHSKRSRTLENYAKSTLPVLYKWNNKAWMATHLFSIQYTVEDYC